MKHQSTLAISRIAGSEVSNYTPLQTALKIVAERAAKEPSKPRKKSDSASDKAVSMTTVSPPLLPPKDSGAPSVSTLLPPLPKVRLFSSDVYLFSRICHHLLPRCHLLSHRGLLLLAKMKTDPCHHYRLLRLLCLLSVCILARLME